MSHAYKTNNSYFSNNWYVHTYIHVYIHLYRNTYFTIVLFPWKHIWTIHIASQQTLWKTIYGTCFCISFSTWFSTCKITTQLSYRFYKARKLLKFNLIIITYTIFNRSTWIIIYKKCSNNNNTTGIINCNI